MSQNICEYLREESIKGLFDMSTFEKCWISWAPVIRTQLTPLNSENIFSLGNSLSDIFKTTRVEGRQQSDLSASGAAWEALVCWYLNLCLVGSRTVVIKYKKELIPSPINDAITVSYGNFTSNTESDLVAITFADKPEYTIDKMQIVMSDHNNRAIPTFKGRSERFNYKPIIEALVRRDFVSTEVGIIQCKTNWNDNAQIPMLWDMIYSSLGFQQRILVGRSGYSIRDLQKFTYSFVTVPSNARTTFTPNSTSVKRVANLSGGNYWGMPTESPVASSINEIFGRNFTSGSDVSLRTRLNEVIPNIATTHSYFGI